MVVEQFDRDYFSIGGFPKAGSDETVNCKALFAAIIDQAVRDYLAYKNPRNKRKSSVRRHGVDAELWLFYENPDNLEFFYEFKNEKEHKLARFLTFENLCHILGWSPDWIRSKVLEMVEQGEYYKLGRRRKSAFETEEDIPDY